MIFFFSFEVISLDQSLKPHALTATSAHSQDTHSAMGGMRSQPQTKAQRLTGTTTQQYVAVTCKALHSCFCGDFLLPGCLQWLVDQWLRMCCRDTTHAFLPTGRLAVGRRTPCWVSWIPSLLAMTCLIRYPCSQSADLSVDAHTSRANSRTGTPRVAGETRLMCGVRLQRVVTALHIAMHDIAAGNLS